MDEQLRRLERDAMQTGDAGAWHAYASALARLGRREDALLAALHAEGLDRTHRSDVIAAEAPDDVVAAALVEARTGQRVDPAVADAWASSQPLVVMRVVQTLQAEDFARARDLIRALAVAPGLLQACTAIRFELRPSNVFRTHRDDRLVSARRMASLLGGCQPLEVLRRLLPWTARQPDLDVVTVRLVHEVVLRGTSLAGDGTARALAARGGEALLPACPLTLLELEEGVAGYLPVYGRLGSAGWRGWGNASPPPGEHRPLAPPLDAPSRRHELEIPATVMAAIEAFASEAPNATIEVRALLGPPGPLDAELLASLDIDCTRGATSLALGRIEAQVAWLELFALFATGGIYGDGMKGAEGRALAWRALGWLVGEEPDAELRDVEAAARRARLAVFTARSPWWNLDFAMALVCMGRDGRVAVLAVTDTD